MVSMEGRIRIDILISHKNEILSGFLKPWINIDIDELLVHFH